ncbi:putative Tetratricopeptide repeat protein 30A [Paratrimastix pyriformis]|uniref:Tetratricopeptide repeat protein 30A n=1 Tax=Paratrimastix pyriformis TaxID=342808 RepID=A0ABQ8UNL4_9EUKA|nr:putative Tetratricopeptide repeat protein 30A [Paratrimastix pyriformis]
MMSTITQIPEGNITKTVYSLIRDRKFGEAIRLLSGFLQTFPKDRGALSLLGFCHYQVEDFESAAPIYEQLARLFPQVDEYKTYYAQSLWKAGQYQDAEKACKTNDNPQFSHTMMKMQGLIKYEQDELAACQDILEGCVRDDPDVMITQAGLLFKEEKFDDAAKKFIDAINTVGYQADLAYNVALCNYRQKQYAIALKYISDVIDRGIKEHPVDRAREALSEMPPRSEEELDPVTLHNQALMGMEADPEGGFTKLNYLLTNPPFPPETFANLLVLYCKHENYDAAGELMAANGMLVAKLPPELREFLEAVIVQQTSPEEAYRKFDLLATRRIEEVRRLAKTLQDVKARQEEAAALVLKDFDAALEGYIPIFMAQAKIYWDLKNFNQALKLFKQSADFCSDNETWKLNLAHVYFMLEQYREAIRYYDPFVDKKLDNLLEVTPIILANLCVAHIMNNRNESAEDLMRKIEREEERAVFQDPEKRLYHHCIVNLVIGTLYCSKSNFEFGISRIMKSLEPYPKKARPGPCPGPGPGPAPSPALARAPAMGWMMMCLNPDTWYYAKRCFAALAENLAKHEVLAFLDAADSFGATISASATSPGPVVEGDGTATIAQEARALKRIFLRLR